MRSFSTLAILLTFFAAAGVTAQTKTPAATVSSSAKVEIPLPAVAITAQTLPIDLAHAALAAMGGDKFKNAKSIFVTGSADVSAPQSTQVLPATFAITYAGENSRLDIQSPFISFYAISTSTRSYSSMKGFQLPSMNKFSTRVLIKIDQPGYVVSGLPDRKKYRAFRVTDPDGDATDFYLDPATGRVMSYEYSYRGTRTVVEHDKFRVVDGVLIPEKFAQKFDLGSIGTAYADFKVKEARVNFEVDEDVFAIPEQ
jgi:hypothetical protein